MTCTNRLCITFVLFVAALGAFRVGVGLWCTEYVDYSVMVISKDSESFNPDSSPGTTFFVFLAVDNISQNPGTPAC